MAYEFWKNVESVTTVPGKKGKSKSLEEMLTPPFYRQRWFVPYGSGQCLGCYVGHLETLGSLICTDLHLIFSYAIRYGLAVDYDPLGHDATQSDLYAIA